MERTIEKATIYLLHCKYGDIDDCYVGSTSEVLNRRWHGHKVNCNNSHRPHYNYKLYKFIRTHGGMDDWIITPIEEFNNIKYIDLLTEEKNYKEIFNSTLNSNRPIITEQEKKQYHIDWKKLNKLKQQEYQKKYNAKNKDKIRKYNKERYRKKKYPWLYINNENQKQ
jgi:hypothetical protein